MSFGGGKTTPGEVDRRDWWVDRRCSVEDQVADIVGVVGTGKRRRAVSNVAGVITRGTSKERVWMRRRGDLAKNERMPGMNGVFLVFGTAGTDGEGGGSLGRGNTKGTLQSNNRCCPNTSERWT